MKKKHTLLAITAFLTATLFGCSQNTESPSLAKPSEQLTPSTLTPQGKTMDVSIVRVIDGDTVKIKLPDEKEETIRLLLIDTPETVHPNKPVEPFGPEASSLVKELLPANSKATLELDVSERDKYGRLLGYLWIDGKMINEILLEKGLARVAYVYAPNTRWVDEFRKIQDEARQKELGIWSIENYATDKGFNSHVESSPTPETSKGCSNPTIKGNISSSGEQIYHMPGQQYYERTKEEELFCTEDEAQKAGFRKSQR